MPRSLKRTEHDSIIREPVELEPLFQDFKVVEVGEGDQRGIALVAKTPEEKKKLAEDLLKADEPPGDARS